MKRLYTFLGLALLGGSASAQYLTMDFETDPYAAGWTNQNPTANDTTEWFVDAFSGNSFAKASNYYGSATGNVPAESWLVSPAINLSAATSPMLYFETVMNFPGPALEVKISTDYDGTSSPATQGTWTDITSLCSLDTDDTSWGNFNTQGSGDVDITTYISANTYIAFVYKGTANDGSTWEIDNISITEGGGGGGSTTSASVYDIQYTTDASGDSPLTGQIVSTGGIVTYVRSDGRFYIKSGNGPYTGVYVYENAQTVAEGDSVTFDAEVVEYFNLTELTNVTNFVNVSSGNFFLSESVTTAEANTEGYEGMLIATCGVVTAQENQYNEYPVNDGSGDVLVDDFFLGAAFSAPTVGNSYNIKGIVDFSFGEFKVLPRTAADVGATTSCTVGITENQTQFNIFPVPAENTLNVEVDGRATVNVYGVDGKLYLNQIVDGLTTLDVSSLSSGVYMIKVGGTTKKFTKM